MQVLHSLRHCCINGGERVGRDQQAQRDRGSEVKAAQEAGPTTAEPMVGKEAMPEGIARHEGCEEKGRAISNIKYLPFVLRGYAIQSGSLQC